MILKQIGVWSAAKVAAVWYAAMGVVAGFFFAVFGLLGGFAAASQGEGSEGLAGVLFGVGAIVLMPPLYGVFGLVFGALGAVLYNLTSRFSGGLELELEPGPHRPDLPGARDAGA